MRSRQIVSIAVLILCLALVACGGGGNGTTISSGSITPAFISTPGTTASEATAYSYQIQTTPSTNVTLALTTSPSGATLSGNTLAWTPTSAQSRVANQFTVTATTSGGSTTQTWSVTPAGTVRGTWVITRWTVNGPVAAPGVDWTKVTGFPVALVPQADGTFQTLTGSGNSDGTFTIPNIPAGYYWLQPAPTAFYWTSSSTFDLGEDANVGMPLKTLPSSVSTQVNFNFAGLDPTQSGDALLFLWNFSSIPMFLFEPTAPFGVATFATSYSTNSNFDFSQPTMNFVLQYEPETIGSLNALRLGASAELPNTALIDGNSNTVSAALTPSPQSTFDLNVKGSAWTSLFDNAGPSSATLTGSSFAVSAEAFVPSGVLPALSSAEITLFAGLTPSSPSTFIALPATSLCNGLGQISTGFSIFPGEPPITTDQDFGTVQYDDPLPSTWLRLFTFCEEGSIPVSLPGSANPVSFQIVNSETIAVPNAPIAPLIGKVENPTLNGTSLFVAKTVGANGNTLSWSAGSGRTPTGYRVTTFVAGNVLGSLTYIAGGSFSTAKTSVSLPPLQTGKTYLFFITAILDGAANFETQPNRSALPTASVSVVSAPITISGS